MSIHTLSADHSIIPLEKRFAINKNDNLAQYSELKTQAMLMRNQHLPAIKKFNYGHCKLLLP